MYIAAKPTTSSRLIRALATGAFLSVCLSAPAFAADAAARLAIGQAQANLELISKESPAGTGDPSFMRAQQKIVDAQAQLAAGRETEAIWRANEAALLANTALASARLISLEQEHRSVRSTIDALQLENRRN
jgi:hypothetical protein